MGGPETMNGVNINSIDIQISNSMPKTGRNFIQNEGVFLDERIIWSSADDSLGGIIFNRTLFEVSEPV